MTVPPCIAALVWLVLLGTASAQEAPGETKPTPATAADAAPDRAARAAERYRGMLAANPAEGVALDRLWQYHEDHGSTAELLDGYRRAAEAVDAPVAAVLVYGHLLKKVGRLDDAAVCYQRAAERQPADPLPGMSLAALAQRRGNPELAANLYGAALGKMAAGDRRRAEVLLEQGTALLAAGKVTEAAAAWEKIVATNPADLAVRRQLADAYEKNGVPDHAIAQYEYIEAHADPAERAAAERDLARLQEAHGQFGAARDTLERGLGLTARDNWLHGELQTQLIRLHQRTGRVPELAARWRAAAEQAPRDLGAFLRLEALAEAEGDLAGEREWLEKIVALSPRDRESVRKLAGRLADAGDVRRAAEMYDGLLKQQPGNLELIFDRADLDVQAGQPEEAIKKVEARVAISPADESVTAPALNFFVSRHLDGASERLLRAGVARLPTAPEPSLALAKFLFAQRRPTEAGSALTALTDQAGSPATKADRLGKAADTYQENAMLDEAIRCWESVAKFRPEDPAPLLAIANLRKAGGDIPGAVEGLQQAMRLAPSEADRLSMEKTLFEALRSGDAGDGFAPMDSAGPMGLPASPGPTPGSRLNRYLADLEEKAEREQTAENYLRLARWQAWAHHVAESLAAAEITVRLDPGNLPARELAASVATELRQPVVAERLLNETLALDSSRESVVLRQLAKLKLQAGDNEEALKMFIRLQELAPGSRVALTDLALAQQRLDRWFDALTTWEQAYALPGATPAQRAEVRRPLLAACEHLGQFARAVEVLLHAVDEQTDLSAKEDLFRQVSDLASIHGLGEPLRAKFDERSRRLPNDYFTLWALAQIHREAGEMEEAYRLLQKAHYSAPDPVVSLRALVQEADALGKTDDAVAQLSRLLAVPGQFTAENLQRLAEFQEQNQDSAAAAGSWNLLVARFPRDVAALEKAVEYFERIDQLDRARDLQRLVAALDGADLQHWLRLAALEVRAGDLPAALNDYETTLARALPEPPDQPLTPPEELTLSDNPLASVFSGMARGRPRVVGPAVTKARVPTNVPAGDQTLRLQTIGEVSRLLFAGGKEPSPVTAKAQADWLARWQRAADAGVRNEPLQAFYFAGQKERTMALLTKWLGQATPGDASVRHAFLAAGLRLGDYQSLARWTWASDEEAGQTARAEELLTALDRYLSTGGKPNANIALELFPATITRRSLLWDAAKAFAVLHWYAPAGELGRRVIKMTASGRAASALEVAEWDLYAGAVPAAREALALAIAEGAGWTLDASVSPVFAAVRESYLLTPESERRPFVSDYLKRMRAGSDSTHVLLAGVLLHGLAGDDEAARRGLDALLARRMLAGESSGPSPDARRWAYLLANGVQLQSWNLDSLAVYLWRQALGEASAFDERFGDAGGMIGEIRRRLVGAEVALSSDPAGAREVVTAYLNSGPPAGAAASLAGELMNNAHSAAAIQIDEWLCRVEPKDGEHWRSLLSAYETAGDFDRSEMTYARLLQEEGALPESLPRADFVERWAAVRERNGDADGACQVLEAERSAAPGTIPLLVQLAQTYARSGKDEASAKTWRELLPLATNATAVLGLADLEEQQGHRDEAIRTLQGGLTHGPMPGQDEVAARLARIYLSAGQTEEAVRLAKTFAHEGRFEPLPAIAASLAAAGQRPAAREILNGAVGRSRDAGLRFRLQQALVNLNPATGEDLPDFLRGMTRLEIIARDHPPARNSWEAIRYKLARHSGADAWLEKVLLRRWDKGKGDYNSGERLAALYLETRQEEKLRATIGEFDHRPMLPDQLLFGLENALVQAGYASMALPLSERLYRRFPQNIDYALGRATVLWKSARRDEADQVFAVVKAEAVLRDDATERVALAYLSLGAKDRAQVAFEQATQTDPAAARAPGNFLQLAHLFSETNRLSEAEAALRIAYRQDACDDFHPLVEFLAASGQLDGPEAGEMPAADFPLSFRRRGSLLATTGEFLAKQGRKAEARSLWLKHAAFLAEAPGSAVELCRDASPGERPDLIRCLRQAAGQFSPCPPRLERALAALDARQKPTEQASSGAPPGTDPHR